MKIKYIKIVGLTTVLAALSLASCNDDFLEEKKDFNGVNEDVFKVPSLATGYVDYVYGLFLPGNNAAVNTWDLAAGGNDDFSQTTEELTGEVNWNKIWATISPNNANCLPYIGSRVSSSIANNTWTRLRQINIFLEQIDKNGMADADKNPLKGQMYFWRAYQYYEMVKLYGGVPIVLTAQNPIIDEGSTVSQIPRSPTSVCIEQIVSDLDKSKELLKDVKWTSANWGRITAGAAAAFKGRVLLTWASPLFNPTDDAQRWKRAYDANLEAKTLLEADGKGLFSVGGTANGTAWGNMWLAEVGNPEAVIVFGFNNSTIVNAQKNNGWERAVRSKASGGNGTISPTKQMVDVFPMADGKSIVGNPAYNPVLFYKNRDPRFYKTFAYNGATWKYAENTAFKQWTYSWYSKAPTTAAPNPDKFTETLGANSSGIYLRKATNEASSSSAGYLNSGIDYMEMRFAEVVLNLAESAIGVGSLAEGKTLIESVRARAGITNGDGHYGLAAVSSRDQHFAAVLNERTIEFAYENKRFYDLRRWKLFDAGATTSRLGVKPLNGTRRTAYYIVAKKADGTNYIGTGDPFYVATGNAPVLNREPASFPVTINGTTLANFDAYLDYMYTNYFKIVERDNLDPTTNNWKFTWYNEYYFFGIYQSLLDSSPYLEQTQGWGGSFDPLK
ncbi:RagB/SusD family nutrient uptake outer membrane protein [Flavobacterium plurextorum]|uniref:RagB/SusD family nutrient uptake outer membrane protein n=2 Tax=Flavobacterium TaxID=237 RepID=A0ABX4CZE4_9FLAO|nr:MULTISPECIES: RagB/SusD family nutrient uptake outer membrane protein [Flavobacterium]OXB11328.1 RagB/SusD family nutrient uptake outer membrane protein [Flavobacterium plurextorum]PIF70866.1 putative outer membrane starch-binding protein [Flavobacterium sp. 2]UUW08066.1 RagB/SusD family nutrient uptake outer membrane protein [Flavobacterium plurextorum]